MDAFVEKNTPQKQRKPKKKPMSRPTERISISLLAEEWAALERLSNDLRSEGHRALKTSRLAWIAFQMLLDADKDTVLDLSEEVPNLEILRGKRE